MRSSLLALPLLSIGLCLFNFVAGSGVPHASGSTSSSTSSTLMADQTAYDSTIDFIIEHSVSSKKGFTPRSKAQIVKRPDGKQGLFFTELNGIYGEDMDSFKDLLNRNELYKIRISSTIANESSPSIISSIPACELQRSGFKEDILVYMGNDNNIIGLSYSSPMMAIARQCDSSKVPESLSFQTRIKVGESVRAQTIPLQALGPKPGYLEKVNLGAAHDEQQKPQQKSFLQRYWYIVVIMVLYLMLGSGSEPQKQPQDTGNGAGQAQPQVQPGGAKQ